ncbi:MAG: PAS domain-containing protein, partial [Polyangiaceae bacterium]
MAKEDPALGGFLQATLLAVLEAADEGLIVFDADGRCRMIGRRAGEIFGLEPAANVGRVRAEVLSAFAGACAQPEVFLEAADADAVFGARAPLPEVEVRRPRPRTVLCRAFSIAREGRLVGRIIL